MKSYTLFKIGVFFFYFALSSETHPEPTNKNYIPKINWSLAEEYFHISNPKIGKYKFRDILGQIVIVDAIEFNITAKSGIPLTLMLKAIFYDSDGIKMSESIITFEKKYNTGFWEIGDPGKGYITMDLKTLSDTRLIEIINFY